MVQLWGRTVYGIVPCQRATGDRAGLAAAMRAVAVGLGPHGPQTVAVLLTRTSGLHGRLLPGATRQHSNSRTQSD